MPEPRRRRPSPLPSDGVPTRPVRLFQAQRHPRSPDPDAVATRPYARTQLLRPPVSHEPPTRVEHPRTLPRAPVPAAPRDRLRSSRRTKRVLLFGAASTLLLLVAAAFALHARQPRVAVAGSTGQPATPSAVTSAPQPTSAPPAAGHPAEVEGALAPPPAASPLGVALSEPPPAVAPPASESRPAAAVSPRAAAEHLAQGRYREALAVYRELARARPEQGAYATFTRLIERRLAQRCLQRLEAGGAACTEQRP